MSTNRPTYRRPIRNRPVQATASEQEIVRWQRLRDETARSIEADSRTTRSVNISEEVASDPDDEHTRAHSFVRPIGWWRMRNQMWIRIPEMADGHLERTIRMLEHLQSRAAHTQVALQEMVEEANRRRAMASQREYYQSLINQANSVPMGGIYAGVQRSAPDGGDLGIGSSPTGRRRGQQTAQAVQSLRDGRARSLEEAMRIAAERERVRTDMQNDMRDVAVNEAQVRNDPPSAQVIAVDEAENIVWIGTPSSEQLQQAPPQPLPNRTRRIR